MVLLGAVVRTLIKFAILAVIMIIGINLGKSMRIKKDTKKDNE